ELKKEGLDVGVINARFIKPLDEEIVARALKSGFLITIEENTIVGGFGSAVLESACRQGLNTDRLRMLGIPDRFIEHGDRQELLSSIQLDADGLCRAARQLNPQGVAPVGVTSGRNAVG
ncbi:MAG: transketolase C-terminal domain-containing protein, partial [Phycisphaerae bacterium]